VSPIGRRTPNRTRRRGQVVVIQRPTAVILARHAAESQWKLTGSHYLTHADFGCMDGDHRAWIIVECEKKEEARNMLPPSYRAQARIVALNKFSLEQIQAYLKHHES